MANWCETWNSGVMLKILVRSARTPVNMELLRKTSRCTSLESVSIVPGLERPSLALRSEKELSASPRVVAIGLAKRRWANESIAEAMMADYVIGGARGSGMDGKGLEGGEGTKEAEISDSCLRVKETDENPREESTMAAIETRNATSFGEMNDSRKLTWSLENNFQ